MATDGEIPEVQGQPPTALDDFWIDFACEITKESVGTIEEGAKEIIRLASLLQGIYFGAAITALQYGLIRWDPLTCLPRWIFVILILAPILIWLGSLGFALEVFLPRTYDKTKLEIPGIAKETCEKIVGYKHRQLGRARLLLFMGFLLLAIEIAVYLAWI